LELRSPLEKELVCDRLRDLLEIHSGSQSATGLTGKISDHHIVIRIRGRRFSSPWRGTFRGTAFPLAGGTVIAGKFDSNWSLLFVGYPILAGVVLNVVVNVLSGYGPGHFAEFTVFTTVAALFCGFLRWIYENDKRLVAAAMCRVSSGKLYLDVF